MSIIQRLAPLMKPNLVTITRGEKKESTCSPLTLKDIKAVKDASSSFGLFLHYLKNIVAAPILGVVRLFMSFDAAKHGGSTSSYFRDENIYKNVEIVSGNLKNLKFDTYNTEADTFKYNDSKKSERTLKSKDIKGEIKAKTFIETTEIAIYRNESGDLYGVNRGTFFNDHDQAILLYKHETNKSKEDQKLLFECFISLNKQIYNEVTPKKPHDKQENTIITISSALLNNENSNQNEIQNNQIKIEDIYKKLVDEENNQIPNARFALSNNENLNQTKIENNEIMDNKDLENLRKNNQENLENLRKTTTFFDKNSNQTKIENNEIMDNKDLENLRKNNQENLENLRRTTTFFDKIPNTKLRLNSKPFISIK